jgi:hypothetical protein
MKKTLVLTIIFAALAIAACSKKEHEVSTNAPSTQETTTPKTDIVYKVSSVCMYWRHDWESDTEACQNRLVYEVFCYMTVGCEDEFSRVAYVAIDPLSNSVKIIKIPFDLLPPSYQDWFVQQISAGYITMSEDSPIDDEDILAVCPSGYIPAGTYPITLENGYVTISFI